MSLPKIDDIDSRIYYNTSQAARLLGMSRTTLIKREKDGLIKCIISPINGHKEYKGTELLRYLTNRG